MDIGIRVIPGGRGLTGVVGGLGLGILLVVGVGSEDLVGMIRGFRGYWVYIV